MGASTAVGRMRLGVWTNNALAAQPEGPGKAAVRERTIVLFSSDEGAAADMVFPF
jgi:hypothetical protein